MDMLQRTIKIFHEKYKTRRICNASASNIYFEPIISVSIRQFQQILKYARASTWQYAYIHERRPTTNKIKNALIFNINIVRTA